MTPLPPDPLPARSVVEFVHLLSALRLWAGNPSFEELRRRTGLPSSTLSDAIRANRARLPKVEVVRRFVVACGGTGADLARWENAWRTIQAVPTRGAGPQQVPPLRVPLVGRQTALDRLDVLRLSAPVVAIVGMPGVGKTALALEWAHRTRDTFDGQLYVDLSDHADALPCFLHGLGVAPRDVPADPAARVGAYRSLSVGRRLLVVLDGARHVAQVRALLPGGSESLALVTSRDLLSGLVVREGARRLTLGPLASADAETLVPGDRRAARELARLCGNLPLALGIALALLADRPHWTVADLLDRLRCGDALAELAVPGASVRAAFDASYDALDAPARELLATLARCPAPPAVVDVPGLAALRAAHLVEPAGKDRYTLHPLVRAYAADLARTALPRPRDLAAA